MEATPPAALEEAAIDTSGIGGHPKGLTTLFFTEMWERFSFYGMKALLILYLTSDAARGGLGYAVAKGALIAAFYNMGVYLTSLPGGWVADRFLGARRAVFLGGVVIAMGHFSMAIPSIATFYPGLCLIVLGTGLLKPNVSTMVGALYSEQDERRDAGFSLFYMGINIGAFLGPIVCGFLAQRIDWHLGFGATGVGMTLGLIQYVAGRKRLEGVDTKSLARQKATEDRPREPFKPEEWKRIAVIGILFFFSVLFWTAFEQASTSLNLFADRLTRNEILGLKFPSSWFQSVNSFWIFLLAPLFSSLWMRLGKRQPSSPAKFAYGLLFVGLGLIVVAYASTLTSKGLVSPMWLITVYFVHTIGELCLSPVGLSTVTKLAPGRVVGFMMGVWFVSIALGNFGAGFVARRFNASSPDELLRMFGAVAGVTIVAAGILAVLTPSIRRLMGPVR